MPLLSEVTDLRVGATTVDQLLVGDEVVWQRTYAPTFGTARFGRSVFGEAPAGEADSRYGTAIYGLSVYGAGTPGDNPVTATVEEFV